MCLHHPNGVQQEGQHRTGERRGEGVWKTNRTDEGLGVVVSEISHVSHRSVAECGTHVY